MKKLLFALALASSMGNGLSANERTTTFATITATKGVQEMSSLKELQETIAKAKGMVFVDFYSTTCPPCRRLSPKFNQYAQDLASKGAFLKVNLNEVSGSRQAYDISAMPTLIVFKGGKEVDRLTGLQPIVSYFEAMQ